VGTLPTPAVRALVPGAASVGSLVRIEGADLFSVAERAHVSFGGVEAALFALGEGSLTVVVPRARRTATTVRSATDLRCVRRRRRGPPPRRRDADLGHRRRPADHHGDRSRGPPRGRRTRPPMPLLGDCGRSAAPRGSLLPPRACR
jgi:hypothetical protein